MLYIYIYMKNIYLQQRRTTASVMDNTGSMGKTVTMEGISPDGHMKPPSEKKTELVLQ